MVREHIIQISAATASAAASTALLVYFGFNPFWYIFGVHFVCSMFASAVNNVGLSANSEMNILLGIPFLGQCLSAAFLFQMGYGSFWLLYGYGVLASLCVVIPTSLAIVDFDPAKTVDAVVNAKATKLEADSLPSEQDLSPQIEKLVITLTQLCQSLQASQLGLETQVTGLHQLLAQIESKLDGLTNVKGADGDNQRPRSYSCGW